MSFIIDWVLGQVPASGLLIALVLVLIGTVLDKLLPPPTATSPMWYKIVDRVVGALDSPLLLGLLEKKVPVTPVIAAVEAAEKAATTPVQPVKKD